MTGLWLAIPGLLIWLSILLLPWRPWSTRENLDSAPALAPLTGEVTVLIPARNEESYILETLAAVMAQEGVLRTIVINDRSTDNTAAVVEAAHPAGVEVVHGRELEPGWSGKLWSLEQGRSLAQTEYVLLLDADITLAPGIIATLLDKSRREGFDLVSLMADLRMETAWEKLLMPAFIYFFKLLYPFSLSNSRSRLVAAAAGGCILLRREALERIGGFVAIRDALIDDCSLARCIKDAGYRTWTGLTHSVHSRRRYDSLSTIWEMVTRTAYTQLRYSVFLLLICSALMAAAFVLPVAGLLSQSVTTITLCVTACVLMAVSYLPTLRYYEINAAWSILLPLSGLLFLLMTWSSALKYWLGTGSSWKDRKYGRTA